MEYFNRHGHYPINVEPALPQWDDCSLNIDERLAALRRVGKQFDPFQLCEYKYTEDYKWKLKALLNIKNAKPMEFPDLPIDQVNLEFDIEDYPEIFKIMGRMKPPRPPASPTMPEMAPMFLG